MTPKTTNPPVLSATGLSKSFGRQRVLRNLNLQLGAGELVGLAGKNGSGKSTLLSILAGLRLPDKGSACVFGEASATASDAALARLAYVAQREFVLQELSPNAYVRFIGSFYPKFDRTYARALLRRLDVDSRAAMASMSLGQRQRVELVRALSVRPGLLLLDEPLSGVDPLGRQQLIQEVLHAATQYSTAVLLTTQVYSDIEQSSVVLALLDRGALAFRESIHSLRGRHVKLRLPSAEWLAKLPAGLQTQALPDGGYAVVAAIDKLAGCDPGLSGLATTAPSLEEIVVALGLSRP